MRIPRLYLPLELAADREVTLPAERAHYLASVLRLRHGARLAVFDGRGGEYHAEVISLGRRGGVLRLGAARASAAESPLAVTLLQAVLRSERMDYALQKATELGVSRIVPVLCERTPVRLDPERAAQRLAHWRGVVAAACEQCGRSQVPCVEAPHGVAQALASVPPGLLLDPGADEGLAAALAGAGERLGLLCGPEGGFSEAERDAALAAGWRPVALGPRVLRAETAAVAALAALQVLRGDLS